jgi:UPF0716 protein FxsA
MVMRLFLVYAVVELAVVIALVSSIGFGWTVLALLATFIVGVAMAGSQVKRHIRRLQAGLTTPQGAVTDSALVALGTVLVFIPGLVSTAFGLLLLLPPTRAAARPILTAMAARGLMSRAPLITVATAGAAGASRYQTGRGDYIDGEVIDVTDVEPDALPRKPE